MFQQTIHIALHRSLTGAAVIVGFASLARMAGAQQPDTTQRTPDMDMPADTQRMAMPMSGPLGISMDRSGSGTTWIPDAVVLPSRHLMAGDRSEEHTSELQ